MAGATNMQPLPMTVVTVFRSRLLPGVDEAYHEVATEMSRLVRLVDGFIDERFYEAADGERVTIARFQSMESEQAWARNPDHLAAQRHGRDEFYSWYEISVAEELQRHELSPPTA
jgi:heme-degrading monooxygenase HmoA